EVLKRKGGKAYQHEIARELEIPKTTLWRHILRLSEEGIVDIKKEGKYNLIILKI
ncbi:MAG: transcriptional regulator TrmB, partial [Thermoprotei archaeon]